MRLYSCAGFVLSLLLLAVMVTASPAAQNINNNNDAERISSYRPLTAGRQIPFTIDFSKIFDNVFTTINRRLGAGSSGNRGAAVQDCDTASFDLSPRDYRAVTDCQLTQSDDEGVKNCILSGGLSTKAEPFQRFLTENEPGSVEIKTAIKSAIKNGKATTVLTVEVSKCLEERISAIDSYEGGLDGETDMVPFGDDVPSPASTSFLDLSNIDRFISSMFPTTSNGGSIFPNFPSIRFPNINSVPEVSSVPRVDMDNCQSKPFKLSVEDFDLVKSCYNTASMSKCVQESNMSNGGFVEFVSDPSQTIVGHSFSSYSAWINGEFSRNHVIRLTRCSKNKEESQEDLTEAQPEYVGTDSSTAEETPFPGNQEP